MTEAPELLPCPFCGGAANAISLFGPPHRGNTFVKCEACGAAGKRGGYVWAISNWNTRADLDATDELALANRKVKALVDALEYCKECAGDTVTTPTVVIHTIVDIVTVSLGKEPT